MEVKKWAIKSKVNFSYICLESLMEETNHPVSSNIKSNHSDADAKSSTKYELY